jgi:hypothetical protein
LPEAVAFRPKAIASSFEAVFWFPNADDRSPVAELMKPKAVAVPYVLAVFDLPTAMAFVLDAVFP